MVFTEADQQCLIAQLHRDEGSKRDKQGRHVAYLDSVGVLTIGYGHNCKTSPVPGVNKPGDTISDELANQLFERDLADHNAALVKAIPWMTILDGARQGVLFNMAFNLGVAGLLTFKNTLTLIRAERYAEAASRMLKSKWAGQVGKRANRLSAQMETGVWK